MYYEIKTEYQQRAFVIEGVCVCVKSDNNYLKNQIELNIHFQILREG